MLYEDDFDASPASSHQQFYLAVNPRSYKIRQIVIEDSPLSNGRPYISGITIIGRKQKGLYQIGKTMVSRDDIKPRIDLNSKFNTYENAARIARLLYTREGDLPENPEKVTLPDHMNATSLTFKGGKEAIWLSNIWAANLTQIHGKFDTGTGYFNETGIACPWYGGYRGIGTWAPIGIYQAAYSRTSDHYVTLALRCINEPRRETSYVDYLDKYLYMFRNNRDPDKGPPNHMIDAERYPADAPPHWAFVMGYAHAAADMLNEIPNDEEMDGHASNIVGRYVAWKILGSPVND